MRKPDPLQVSAAVQLAAEATRQATEVVEAMHARISPLGGRQGAAPGTRARGISGFTYEMVRRIAASVALAFGRLLGAGAAPANGRPVHPARAVLNGISGHHLEELGNPLAIPMSLRHRDQPLVLERDALRHATGGRLLVLVHGLCMNDRQWLRQGHDHGAALAAELGYEPLYLRYNSGLHVTENGAALSRLLERLVEEWPAPVTELTVLAHSMGGLVARSACAHADRESLRWRAALKQVVFLGTPHLGAPLERAGNLVHRGLAATWITAPLARLGAIRSPGITDLRYGGIGDPPAQRFAAGGAAATDDALPEGVECFRVAASLGRVPGDLLDRVMGDGLVPVESALGPVHCRDPEREWVGYGLGHLDLLSDAEVYRRIRGWLSTD
jgi:hypothetical protein